MGYTVIGYPYNTTMNLPRFYCPEPLSARVSVALPENAARHASRVLRLREGDEMVLFDGTGGEYVARISEVIRERVSVDVLDWRDIERESPIKVTLVQALQSGEKMDLTIQKSVELGVASVIPVSSRRSVVKLEGERAARRVQHWRGIAASACEQCGRNRVPPVAELGRLDRFLETPAAPDILRLMLVPGAAKRLSDFAKPPKGARIELLIGAEGGLAPEEIDRATQAGYVGVQFGPRILRTETAGLAALAVIQCLWGDLTGE